MSKVATGSRGSTRTRVEAPTGVTGTILDSFVDEPTYRIIMKRGRVFRRAILAASDTGLDPDTMTPESTPCSIAPRGTKEAATGASLRRPLPMSTVTDRIPNRPGGTSPDEVRGRSARVSFVKIL